MNKNPFLFSVPYFIKKHKKNNYEEVANTTLVGLFVFGFSILYSVFCVKLNKKHYNVCLWVSTKNL